MQSRALPRPFVGRDQPRWLGPALLIVGAVAIVATFVADVRTPGNDEFTPLEVVPVALAAWLTQKEYRVLLALGITLAFVAARLGGVTLVSALSAVVAMIGAVTVIRLARREPAPTEPGAESALPVAPSWAEGLPLTKREAEVAVCAARGMTAPEIAAQLLIGQRTVETHLAHVVAKLNLSGKRDLVQLAERRAAGG